MLKFNRVMGVFVIITLFYLTSCNKKPAIIQNGHLYMYSDSTYDLALGIFNGEMHIRSAINEDTAIYFYSLEPLEILDLELLGFESFERFDLWSAQPVFELMFCDNDSINYLPEFKVDERYGIVKAIFYSDSAIIMGDILFRKYEPESEILKEWYVLFQRESKFYSFPMLYDFIEKDEYIPEKTIIEQWESNNQEPLSY